jgi:hypothetical protein
MFEDTVTGEFGDDTLLRDTGNGVHLLEQSVMQRKALDAVCSCHLLPLWRVPLADCLRVFWRWMLLWFVSRMNQLVMVTSEGTKTPHECLCTRER